METRWLYRTAEDFDELRKASNDTCVIPMGCVEKHGLHLPLGIDILHSSHIAHMASQLETCCVFPDFTFGDVKSNAPIEPNGPSPEAALRNEADRLADAIKLYKEGTLLWEVHEQRQRGRK